MSESAFREALRDIRGTLRQVDGAKFSSGITAAIKICDDVLARFPVTPHRSQWIVVTGNPIEGFLYTGPFATNDDAHRSRDGETDNWLAHLQEPA